MSSQLSIAYVIFMGLLTRLQAHGAVLTEHTNKSAIKNQSSNCCDDEEKNLAVD